MKEFRLGITSAFPIIIGYFTIAMAFGMLAKNVGVNILETTGFSVIVFAGASQFMAINLLASGVGTIQIIFATFLMNLRHLLMSASISVKLENKPKPWLPFLAFGVTDETFSVASFQEGKITTYYLLGLQISSYLAWVTGTATGFLIGNVLPVEVQSSLGIGLYAMFAALLIPNVKKSKTIGILACSSGLLNTVLKMTRIVPEGWNLVTSIVVVSALGAIFLKDEENADNKDIGSTVPRE